MTEKIVIVVGSIVVDRALTRFVSNRVGIARRANDPVTLSNWGIYVLWVRTGPEVNKKHFLRKK